MCETVKVMDCQIVQLDNQLRSLADDNERLKQQIADKDSEMKACCAAVGV